MRLVLRILAAVIVGVGVFYGLMRTGRTRDEARRATTAFAALWVPMVVVIVIATSSV